MKLVHLYKHLRVCHESTLWTNVSVILDLYTPTLSLFLLPLSSLDPYIDHPIHLTLSTLIIRVYLTRRYIRNKLVSLKNHLLTYATLKIGTYMLHRPAGYIRVMTGW